MEENGKLPQGPDEPQGVPTRTKRGRRTCAACRHFIPPELAWLCYAEEGFGTLVDLAFVECRTYPPLWDPPRPL